MCGPGTPKSGSSLGYSERKKTFVFRMETKILFMLFWSG